MREVISGAKKVKKEAHAVMDTNTNKLVVANSNIKKVTLDYCLKVLENNKPAGEVKQLIELKEMAHELQMKDKEKDVDYEISDADIFETVREFEAKKSRSNEFIVNTGVEYKLAMLSLCRRFIRTE